MVFNLDGVDELNLDAATLAGIFKRHDHQVERPRDQGRQPRRRRCPSTAITAVHRSDDSGTTENFTDYLNKTAPDVWTAEADGVGPSRPARARTRAPPASIDAVTNGTGTIGYADASRAGDLGVAKVKVGDEFVGYSADGAAAIVDESPEAEGRTDGDIAIDLDRTSDDRRRLPDRPGQLPHRLRVVRGRRPGRARQGVPRLRHQRRGPAGRGRRRRLGAALELAAASRSPRPSSSSSSTAPP